MAKSACSDETEVYARLLGEATAMRVEAATAPPQRLVADGVVRREAVHLDGGRVCTGPRTDGGGVWGAEETTFGDGMGEEKGKGKEREAVHRREALHVILEGVPGVELVGHRRLYDE